MNLKNIKAAFIDLHNEENKVRLDQAKIRFVQ